MLTTFGSMAQSGQSKHQNRQRKAACIGIAAIRLLPRGVRMVSHVPHGACEQDREYRTPWLRQIRTLSTSAKSCDSFEFADAEF